MNALTVGAFLAGLFTVAQFSFWGNYLPRVYPVHLRGTGEGFAANIGGRMIGTSFAWVTNTLAANAWTGSDAAGHAHGVHGSRGGAVCVPGRHDRLRVATRAACGRSAGIVPGGRHFTLTRLTSFPPSPIKARGVRR